ncbi:MAG: YebC/PmpR family DNA-binding transcriptional regulator [Myxococcales bacterium FL481]|nr:MAG: YebC/PmpR family DNA-binding transcriptional regulator [Myxococcales bacterium FL481]
MGRTFENRKQAMLKRGDRDAKAFTRCGKQIAMAVRAGGPDADNNPALRRAIQNARAVNMPKDRIQGAIEKASGAGDTDAYEPVLYEGYGPHGVALLVETATDNPTRTVANIRFAFKKEGGNLGSPGSVAFMFDQFGVFRLRPDAVERDELELELIDDGLSDLVDGEDDDGKPVLVLRCNRDDFGRLQAGLESRQLAPVSSGFEWVPKTTTAVSDEQADAVLKLVARLEDDDDVQEVFHNLA